MVLSASGFACEYPDQGTMPLHRAVKKAELVPEVDAWSIRTRESGEVVQFVVRLDQPVRAAGRCYWTVEIAANGKLWERFYVTPDGSSVRAGLSEGRPASLAEWRRARRTAAAAPREARTPRESTAR